VLLPNLGGPCSHIPGPSESSFAIVQLMHNSQDLPADSDHLVLFPTRYAPYVPAALPARSAGRTGLGRQVWARTRAIRQVLVLEVAGRLSDVVEGLDQAIQMSLAEGPRGVVCDLSGVLEGAETVAVGVLATAGRHVRDWPGIPVAVASPDPQVREKLCAHPLGAYLIVTESTFSAMSAVLSTPVVAVERLRLAPHPTAPRASREFVTRTLNNWRLGEVIPFANLVVSELVASSSIHAGTDIDVSVAWNLGALRLTVRDHGPALPGQQPLVADLDGRGLTVVAGLSRTYGVLPTTDGGNVVWAVFEAPRVRPSTSNGMQNSQGEPVKDASIVKLSRPHPGNQSSLRKELIE
jgi:hypothetical protein